MRIFSILAMSAISLAASAPAMAQGMMARESAMQGHPSHMSAADTRMMNNCKAMPQERMMRNRGCARMMRMHPDMMKQDNMMKSEGMMKKN